MTLSSRDLEEARSKPFKETWFTSGALFLVRLIKKIPYFKRKIDESMGGLSGAIFRCQDSGDHLRATKIAVYAIEKFRNKKDRFFPFMAHHHWWQFMTHAAESAGQIDDHELREKLIHLAENGIEPFEGNYVAVAFLEFSRWKYREENYEKAIEYAELAVTADGTWAEPDFILGWYGLILGKGNAEEHLSQAIEKDKRILFRVASNDLCKQYPAIIRRLKERYTLYEDGNGPNNGMQTDAAEPRR
ncbi:MAG: hypothetical protein V7721_02055 [Porticoccaceae bacterium]